MCVRSRGGRQPAPPPHMMGEKCAPRHSVVDGKKKCLVVLVVERGWF